MSTEITRECDACLVIKRIEDFPLFTRWKEERQTTCRRCKARATTAQWQANNRERTRANLARWHQENKDRRRDQARARYKERPEIYREKALRFQRNHREQHAVAEHNRRARIRGVTIEKIDPGWIWKRDKGICQLCKIPIDPSLSGRNPMRKSLDHIIPISRGGIHANINLQLAHQICNVKRREYGPAQIRLFD